MYGCANQVSTAYRAFSGAYKITQIAKSDIRIMYAKNKDNVVNNFKTIWIDVLILQVSCKILSIKYVYIIVNLQGSSKFYMVLNAFRLSLAWTLEIIIDKIPLSPAECLGRILLHAVYFIFLDITTLNRC